MNKTLSATRIYSLKSYENLQLTDTITDIPEEFALNKEAMGLLRYLQLLDIETAYFKYGQLLLTLRPQGVQEALKLLEEERIRTFEQFLTTIKGIEKE